MAILIWVAMHEETADSTIANQAKSLIKRTFESMPEDATEEDLEAAYAKCSAKTRELDTGKRLPSEETADSAIASQELHRAGRWIVQSQEMLPSKAPQSESCYRKKVDTAYAKCCAKTRELDTGRRLSSSLRKLCTAPS